MTDDGITRRVFLFGSAAGALLVGCGGHGGGTRGGARRDGFPVYAALTANPNPPVPEALRKAERSDLLIDRAQALQQILSTAPHRPSDDQADLTTRFMTASATRLLNMVRDIAPTGARTLAFNRCPRIETVTRSLVDQRR